MTAKEQKAQLRKEILAKRDQLLPEQRTAMSLEAARHGKTALNAILNVEPGQIVSGFFPIRSEIDPRPLMDHFSALGARLCLPVVMDRETIIFRELVEDTKLVDTGFGTRGPSESAKLLDPEILLMPLSVYDKKGGRIGYGAGHYDRAIEKLVRKGLSPRLIGMGFSLQGVDSVPVEAHDYPLEAMITEKGYHAFDRNEL